METLTVIVATFGDPEWERLARRRAIPSAEGQGAEIIHIHGETLHEARNEGAGRAAGDWLVFLDADDSLAPGYVKAILAGHGDLRTPLVEFIENGRSRGPRFFAQRPIRAGNWMVIGTALRRDLFHAAGGFQPWRAYEDWALFMRCMTLGAQPARVRRAIYKAYVNPEGRNRVENSHELCEQIRADHDRWAAALVTT